MSTELLTRERAVRAGLFAAAAACLALAACFALLALDATRWQESLRAEDIRFGVFAEDEGWEPSTILPRGASGTLLGVDDDLEFREALRAFRRARLEDDTVSDPELALARNEAQARLEAIVGAPGDPVRRSRAAGLLGVLGLVRLVSETQQREVLLQYTLTSLERAIALDPGNDEAKANLELALQRGRSVQLTEAAGGQNPSPGGRGSRGAGAGDPGSGY